jgi:hypothetical protein
LVSLEVSVLGTNVLELACGWVDDLHIASKVLVSIDLGEVAEGLVCDLGDIELVVADSQQVVIDILEDGVGYDSVGGCSVTETSAIVQILVTC